MTVDWNGYELYHPAVPGPPEALSRAEARQAYNALMHGKALRIDQLRRLLTANGVQLGASRGAIQDLNDWFYDNVEPDPDRPGRLLPDWYSVVVDIGLFLGDVMIERHPHLRWELFTWGKRNVSYQHHVIMGFKNENPKFHTNIDVERILVGYGHRVVQSRGSIPTYGTVTVRGAKLDLDAAAERHRAEEVETDAFWRMLQRLDTREA